MPLDDDNARNTYYRTEYPTYASRAKAVNKAVNTPRTGGASDALGINHDSEWNATYERAFGYDPDRIKAASRDSGLGTIHSADPLLRIMGGGLDGSGSANPSPGQRANAYVAAHAQQEQVHQADHLATVRNEQARGRKLGPMRSNF